MIELSKFCKEPAAGPAIGDLLTVRSHDLETACHFPRGGAVFAEEIGDVGNAKGKGRDVLDDGDSDACALSLKFPKIREQIRRHRG